MYIWTKIFDSGAKALYWSFFLWFVSLSKVSATSHPFEIQSIDKLSSGVVHDIVADADHIFIAAENGVYRISGNHSELLVSQNSLKDGYITDLFSDLSHLFISVYGVGINRYDKQTGELIDLRLHETKDKYVTKTVKNRNLLLASFIGGYYIYDFSLNEIVSYFRPSESESPGFRILDVKATKSSFIVLASNGVFAVPFDLTNSNWPIFEHQLLSTEKIESIATDQNHAYLIDKKGVEVWDLVNNEVSTTYFSKSFDSPITASLVDSAGFLKIAAGEVFSVSPKGKVFRTGSDSFLSKTSISKVSKLFNTSKKETLLASTRQGLLKIPPTIDSIEYLSHAGKNFNDTILDAVEIEGSKSLLASKSGFFILDTKTNVMSDYVRFDLAKSQLLKLSAFQFFDVVNCLRISTQNSIQIKRNAIFESITCSQNNIVNRVESFQYVSTNSTKNAKLLEFSDTGELVQEINAPQNIYRFAVSRDKKIIGVEIQNNLVEYENGYWQQKIKLSNSMIPIPCLTFDEHQIVFCTQGSGVGLIDIDYSNLSHGLTEKDSFQFVRDLEKVDERFLVASNMGLYLVDPDANDVFNIGREFGVFDSDFARGGIFKIDDEHLLILGDNYTYSIEIAQFLKTIDDIRNQPLDFKATYFSAGESEFFQPELIFNKIVSLEANQDQLHFTLVPDSRIDSHFETYEYQLEGLDNQWTQAVGFPIDLVFRDLSHGEYKLKLRSSLAEDSEPIVVAHIIINPPFYLTTKAKITYLILLCVLVSVSYVLYRRHEVRQAAETSRRVKSKLVALKSSSEMMDKMLLNKQDAIARISHEIKSPLMLVIEPLKKLAKHIQEPELIDDIDIIERNAQRVKMLVEQILEIERLSNLKDIPYHHYDIESTCVYLVESIRPMADNKRQKLDLKLKARGDIYIIQDTLPQIFYNLLSNAIKYSPPDSRIKVETKTDSYALIIKVSDEGPGLNFVEQENIFNRFSRLESSNNEHGTGLGLSLLRQLIKANKGYIEVESKPGEGASFIVRLPLELPLEKPIPVVKSQLDVDDKRIEAFSAQVADTDKPVLLIAEDNPDLRTMLQQLFENDFLCFAVKNGKAAAKAASTLYPEALITDQSMPGMTGLDLVTQLREDPKHDTMSIFMFSGLRDDEVVRKAHDLRVDDFIFKPFDQQLLRQKVLNSLFNRQSKADNKGKSAALFLGITPKLEGEKDQQFYLNLKQILATHANDCDFSREQCSKLLYVSERQLNRKLKMILDLSFSDVIKQFRVDLAKQALKDGKNVTDTAYECGFSNPSYFSTAFKAEVGVAPSEYSKQPEEV